MAKQPRKIETDADAASVAAENWREKMIVTFMVDDEIEKEDDMDAVPRVGETVWFNLLRDGRRTYTPGKVTAVDWHGSERAELRISTGR